MVYKTGLLHLPTALRIRESQVLLSHVLQHLRSNKLGAAIAPVLHAVEAAVEHLSSQGHGCIALLQSEAALNGAQLQQPLSQEPSSVSVSSGQV